MTPLESTYQFAHPLAFLLLFPLGAAVWWFWKKGRRRDPEWRFSSLSTLEGLHTWRSRTRPFLPLLPALAAAALIIALARPQNAFTEQKINGRGIDIFLVIDLSTSMLAEDFQPNRLEVAKRVAREFVSKRPYDRIGLSVFSGEAFTQCPLTTDHRVLDEFLANLTTKLLSESGTAIGMGLASAVNRIKDSDAKSKVVILLTDGDNNAGYIPPETAAGLAQEFGIRVYTIGVGTSGFAQVPYTTPSGGNVVYRTLRVEINEELLRSIAETTGGKYYRASSEKMLEEVYASIDRLEKTDIEITTIQRETEAFFPFALAGLALLLLERLLRLTIFGNIP